MARGCTAVQQLPAAKEGQGVTLRLGCWQRLDEVKRLSLLSTQDT